MYLMFYIAIVKMHKSNKWEKSEYFLLLQTDTNPLVVTKLILDRNIKICHVVWRIKIVKNKHIFKLIFIIKYKELICDYYNIRDRILTNKT